MLVSPFTPELDASAEVKLCPSQLYMGERPWAGLRPVQIILKKSQGKALLTWPAGAPSQYQALSDRCLAVDYKKRPVFAEVRSCLVAPLLVTSVC